MKAIFSTCLLVLTINKAVAMSYSSSRPETYYDDWCRKLYSHVTEAEMEKELHGECSSDTLFDACICPVAISPYKEKFEGEPIMLMHSMLNQLATLEFPEEPFWTSEFHSLEQSRLIKIKEQLIAAWPKAKSYCIEFKTDEVVKKLKLKTINRLWTLEELRISSALSPAFRLFYELVITCYIIDYKVRQ